MRMGRAILIVDDDPALRAILAEQLSLGDEFAVTEADSIAEANQSLTEGEALFDALIVAVSLPDGDGRDFCAALRRQGVKVPILILTASDAELEIVRGLNSGANDCIAKPFRMGELLARLRAQLRQFDNSADATVTIGGYLFRPSAKALEDVVRGKRIRLTEKETAMLKFLYRANGEPVARGVLLGEVWGYNAAATTHTLETHIYRLRQKIEADPANATLLLTEGGGYRLNPNG